MIIFLIHFLKSVQQINSYKTFKLVIFSTVPGPVRSFLYSSVTETTIQLEWQKPLKPNGVLRNYQVSRFKLKQ